MPVIEGIESPASFEAIRYAQVWEDADILLAALAPRPGALLASIASAGDNVLALLTADPARVVVVDLSAAQLACLGLRIAAYRTLNHAELLQLMGSRPSNRRDELLARAAATLDSTMQAFWLARRQDVVRYGIGGVGKFERYFRLFRQIVLPLVHGPGTIGILLMPRDPVARAEFYKTRWNSWRWQLLVRLFFSRRVMGRAGRDPAFFEFAQGSLAEQVAAKTRYALTENDPAANPYLHWILTGRHGDMLPLALREEYFDTIRNRLDRIEYRQGGIETLAAESQPIDGWNLSDIFEYMPASLHHDIYATLLDHTAIGGRLVYWNMMVPRSVPSDLAPRVRSHDDLAVALSRRDQAFFYSALRIEERRA